MCFTEFIGYTCGHTSLEVLRPCPMTTHSHANPVCSSHGRRPILAEEMCPACQRILHGRAVMILEWEHHWMHERAVCGCPVVFPDLIQPRVIGRGQTFGGLEQSQPQANRAKTIAEGKNKNNGKMPSLNPETHPITPSTTSSDSGPGSLPAAQPMALHKKAAAKKRAGSRKTSNIQATPGNHKGNKPHDVSIRMPSLYGVEWIDEHRWLHKAGSCNCEGDFSLYKTPEAYGDIPCSLAGPPYAGLEGDSLSAYQHGHAPSQHSGFAPNYSQPQQNFRRQSAPHYTRPMPYLAKFPTPGARNQDYQSQNSQTHGHKAWYEVKQPCDQYQSNQSWPQIPADQQVSTRPSHPRGLS